MRVRHGDDEREQDPWVGYNGTRVSARSEYEQAKADGATDTYMVTRLAWMAARLVSSKSETRYASAASWRAIPAEDWNRRSVY